MNERTRWTRERTPQAFRATPMAGLWRAHRGLFVTLFVSALFLASVGAFDTSHAPLAARFSYWISVMLIGGGIAVGVLEMFDRNSLLEGRPWLQNGALVLLISVPQTLVVWGLTTLLLQHDFDAAGIASVFPGVALLTAAVTALQTLADRVPVETHAADNAEPPALLRRLPLRLQGAELYAVQAEGHYVRVHTERGSDLLLMRLAEAMRELEGLEGAQTHRSWWVAKAAVAGVRRGEGRARLKLKNGAEAPVSRTYARALRNGGWF